MSPPAARRAQLLETVVHVVSLRGPSATRLHPEIATRVGITTAIVFFYFEARERLIEAVLVTLFGADRLARRAVERHDCGELAARQHSRSLGAADVVQLCVGSGHMIVQMMSAGRAREKVNRYIGALMRAVLE
ncbi:MAG: hypothetical protein AB7Q81_25410 [Gammaproteobacteria bacterium]|uniref:hypothetical protein n=1 Tax=Bradyrhizobium sp. TaxID=376 RepID=UPI003D1524A9